MLFQRGPCVCKRCFLIGLLNFKVSQKRELLLSWAKTEGQGMGRTCKSNSSKTAQAYPRTPPPSQKEQAWIPLRCKGSLILKADSHEKGKQSPSGTGPLHVVVNGNLALFLAFCWVMHSPPPPPPTPLSLQGQQANFLNHRTGFAVFGLRPASLLSVLLCTTQLCRHTRPNRRSKTQRLFPACRPTDFHPCCSLLPHKIMVFYSQAFIK